jgi:uncharacterized protein (TIGR01777 family)
VTLTASQSKIIIAGGTGFLGQLLSQSFLSDGHEVILFSRCHSTEATVGRAVFWDAENLDEWVKELDGANLLINLTGKSIDCRHTKANREEILKSRILSTRVLGQAITSLKKPPNLWLNASSMALYGQCVDGNPPHDESSPVMTAGFLEEVTCSWEDEFFKYSVDGVRQIALRISFILGHASGAFPFLKKLTKMGLGGAQGRGTQWMSWLHQDDWVSIIRFLTKNKNISGAINLSSPNPVTNRTFMQKLRELEAPLGIGIPAPSIGVKLGCALLGSASELALQSRKVVPKKLTDHGYRFLFPNIDGALSNLCN